MQFVSLCIGLESKMSQEYKTLNNCIEQLELGLKSDITKIAYFLHREGFIADGLLEDVLRPALSEAYKANKLVFKIRDSVKLDSSKYHKLINHFRQCRHFNGIVQILDREFFGGIGILPPSEGPKGMLQ